MPEKRTPEPDERPGRLEEQGAGYIVAMAAGPAGGGDVSEPFEVLRAGDFDRGGRKLSISEADLDKAVENFNRWMEEGGEIPVDYDHSFGERGDSTAAGWYTELKRKGKSLFARVRWTTRAAKQIADGEYRFFSPEFTKDWRNESGTPEGFTILAGALTNRPFLRGMTPVALSQDVEGQGFAAMADSLSDVTERLAEVESQRRDETPARVTPPKAKKTPGNEPEKFTVEIDGEAKEFTAEEIVEFHRKAAEADAASERDKKDAPKVEQLSQKVDELTTALDTERFNTAYKEAKRKGQVDAKDETRETWDKRLEKFGLEDTVELLEDLPLGKVPVGAAQGRGGGEQSLSQVPEGVDEDSYLLDQKAQEILTEKFDGKDEHYGEAVRLAQRELAGATA
jgi:phage I-like protein